ncbi:hypothetical protein [Deinococcus cellulosilyticus]|uniref:Lipoprotein n=1 Tax=Deinococcus cellulosilyticus (strain DSM 18568 / NBRC 106333 / KACC 11606 / 5516J-15) TaxID=1223518 RepID=A0A511N2P1_DEIC1|nr:hypothetical protein [Deinococcus cellulosilyticus]GEM47120.1 hypothetical protein DC3_27550 [Deinococcus cellulosilyticus NBRC 106333 = KACC 11606]
MRLLHGLFLTGLLTTSCGWMACGCVPPAGLNFNVFRQSAPAALTGVVDATGKASFEWPTTAANVSIQTAGLPTFADVMPHLTGTFEIDPAPSASALVFQDVQGTLALQEATTELQIPLEDQDWTLQQKQGQYIVSSFLALQGRTPDPKATADLLSVLESGPEHQVHLNFSVQTTLPAGTHITLWLQETRVHFR